MRIIGIDPGLKATGYGLIDCGQAMVKVVETGTINPSRKDLLPQRLLAVHQLLQDIIDQYAPDVLVLEKLYAHHKHPTTASILGHLRGVICLLCAQKKIQLAEHSVKRIRKALTGNGNATKLQTQRIVGYRLKIDEGKLNPDASDALALALGYVDINKSPERRLPVVRKSSPAAGVKGT